MAITWMAKQAIEHNWYDKYKEAMNLFIKGIFKVAGILVRDTNNDQRDLDIVYTHCADNNVPRFLLIAFYLPFPINECFIHSCNAGGLIIVK